jgi:malate synthase
MNDRIEVKGLSIAKSLYDFAELEALLGTGVTSDSVWTGVAALVRDFGLRNRQLLAVRDELQALIDDYHRASRTALWDQQGYERFLRKIGYLLPEPAAFAIRTKNVDDEIAHIAGPQLVVPLSNARYALNAANARWGSLYDALYGTDAIPDDGGAARGKKFNRVRGERAIAYGRNFSIALRRLCMAAIARRPATPWKTEN